MNIKEALEKLEEYISIYEQLKCQIQPSEVRAIETVLAELEKKDKRIRDYEKGIERLKQQKEDYFYKWQNKHSKYKKQEKIINLMAEKLTTDIHSKEWVIDYYERKIKEEK